MECTPLVSELPGRWRTDFENAFRRQYFPRRYAASLRRDVANRYQKPGEKFEVYAAEMTLIRRAGGFTPEEQLELLYDHMRAEYKVYVRIDDVFDVIELQNRATDYEEIEQSKIEKKKRERSTINATVAVVYNRRECCWRCKQRGVSSANRRPGNFALNVETGY